MKAEEVKQHIHGTFSNVWHFKIWRIFNFAAFSISRHKLCQNLDLLISMPNLQRFNIYCISMFAAKFAL